MTLQDGVRNRWDEYEEARERFLSRFEARRGARPSGARAPEPGDPEMLMLRYLAGWNARDADACAACLAADAVREWRFPFRPERPADRAVSGRGAIADEIRTIMDALPLLRVEVHGMLRSGDRMSAHWVLAGPSGDAAAAPVEVSGLAVWRFADQGIAAERIHYISPAVHPLSRGASEPAAD
jgi:hypothetical protein